MNIVLNILRYIILVPLTWPLLLILAISWALDPEWVKEDDLKDIYTWRKFV